MIILLSLVLRIKVFGVFSEKTIEVIADLFIGISFTDLISNGLIGTSNTLRTLSACPLSR